MTKDPVVCPDCGAEDFSCRQTVPRPPMILTLAEQQRRAEGMGSIRIPERVYLDKTGHVTMDEGKAERLWATPGMEVTEEEAARVGYQLVAFPEPKAKAVRRVKDKAVQGPGGDK